MSQYSESAFSTKLKSLRLESGMSQERLAKKLGISRSCLANYETGKREPDHATMVHIANVFHVLIDYLLDRIRFRNLDFSPEEIFEFTNLKQTTEERGCVLNLSLLPEDERTSLIAFYDRLKLLSDLKQFETKGDC